MTDVSDPDSTYGYTYDADWRLLNESNSGTSGVPTVVLTNSYDPASNRTKLTSTIGGTADFENDYSYDNLLRLTRVDQIGQSGGNTVASKRVDFGYDDASRLTSLVRKYKPSGTWTEVATTAFSYDTIDRLTGIDHKQGGTSLFTPYSYTFDNANRITANTSQDGTVAYTYDATSQITGADYSFQTDEAFSWSANGNRSNTGYTTGTNNKMTSDGVYNYTYDNEGNPILRVKISDGSRRELTWDHRNRLTNITERATQYGAATMTVDYVYDTFDRRISKSFDADGAGGGSAVNSRYVFDGSDNPQPILQFDGSNTLTHRNLWALDQIFAAEDSSNAILWSLGDNLGTVRDLVNSSGTVQNHLTYDAFGKVTSETASSIDFLMGFAGMVRDEETGMSYAWHRYQQGGRWISEDPIEILAGDPNYQRVVGNHPTMATDPDGLEEKKSWSLFGWLWKTSEKPPPPPKPERPKGTFAALIDDLYEGGDDGQKLDLVDRKRRINDGEEIAKQGQSLMVDMMPGVGPAVNGVEALAGKNVHNDKLTLGERAGKGGTAVLAAVPLVPDELLAAKAAAKSTKAAKPLTSAQKSAISKIDNAIRDHLKPHDFTGSLRDALGNPVPKRTGGFFDHVKEMNDTLRGLRNNADKLKDATDPAGQAAYQRAIDAIKQIEKHAEGAGL